MLSSLLAAATAVNLPTNLVTILTGSGVFGVILLDVSVTHKVFVPRWVHDQIVGQRDKVHAESIAQRDRIEAEKDAQIEAMRAANAVYTDQWMGVVVPTLTRAVDANKEQLDFLRDRARRDAGD